MADYVGPSRTAEEVREHAYKYFLKLQSESNAEDREVVAGGERALDDGTWTLEQDVAFENALAMFDEGALARWPLRPGLTCSPAYRAPTRARHGVPLGQGGGDGAGAEH